MTYQVTYTRPNIHGVTVVETEVVRALSETAARVAFFRRKPARVQIVSMTAV